MPQHEVYPLPRNAEEARRLNTQHQVWTKLVGYHIHPSIEANLPPNPHIADIGTGTAAFLIDMNNQHPSATLDGFDISDKLFPPVPSNIKLHLHDLRRPFPKRIPQQVRPSPPPSALHRNRAERLAKHNHKFSCTPSTRWSHSVD